jgi:transcriptional regulator with XRE-family HTH domain
MARPKSPWGHAHIRLRRLYDERIAPVMSQKEFTRLNGFGSQAVVAQYLSGAIPLNYDAAAKFARAMGVTITDICPEMANTLAFDIFPVLGKALRRAAVFLLVLLAPGYVPSDARSETLHNQSQTAFNSPKSLSLYTFVYFLRWLFRIPGLFRFEHM